jgi:hypothetical protein
MAERVTTVSERASTTNVNNIEHIESNSFDGIAVIKIYLQPGSSIDAAIAEVTAECRTILTARYIEVVGSLVASGSARTVQKLFDLAQADPVRVFVNVTQADVSSVKR